MIEIEFEVDWSDINHGQRGECHHCPVARAIKRQLSGIFVSVGASRICLEDIFIDLPKEVSKFIKDFDQSKKVKPFKFTLNVPSRLIPSLIDG